MRDKDLVTVDFKSLLLPGWHNGLLLEWFDTVSRVDGPWLMSGALQYESPDFLPPPEHISLADQVHALEALQTSGYTSVETDVSALSLSDFLAAPRFQSGRFSALQGFGDLAENACAQSASPMGPLHPRTFLLLFYRRDSLELMHTLGLWPSTDPPRDWQALLELLRAHAATSASGSTSGLPRYGLCLTTHPDTGRLGDVLAAIAASVVQSNGSHQGYVFDLTTAPPAADALVASAGWRYAASLLQQLLQYNAPDYQGQPPDAYQFGSVSRAFLYGDCLITMDWDATLPSMASTFVQQPGMLGVAPLPGSRVVLDRREGATSGDPVACSPALCAASMNHDLLYLQGAKSASVAPGTQSAQSGGAPAIRALSEYWLAAEAAEVARLQVSWAATAEAPHIINRAPFAVAYDMIFSVSYLGFATNPKAVIEVTALQQLLLTQLDAYRAERQHFTDGLRAKLGYINFSGVNMSAAQRCSSYATARWWDALTGSSGQLLNVQALKNATGLTDEVALQAYVRALWHAMHHPNMAPDVQSPTRINWFKYALGHAAYRLVPRSAVRTASTNSSQSASSVDAALTLLAGTFAGATQAMGESAVRDLYSASISAPAWTARQLDTPEGPSSQQTTSSLPVGVVIAIALPTTVVLLLLGAAMGLLLWYRKRHQRGLLGQVLAPRVGLDTTLLITDIQNSTVLWEQLESSVMDVALKLHHAAIRRLLGEHDGYESATEGDSFIVAFANPAAAVAFASACQIELLGLNWPAALLEHPDGSIVLMEPNDVRAAIAEHLPANLNWQQPLGRMTPPLRRARTSLQQPPGAGDRKAISCTTLVAPTRSVPLPGNDYRRASSGQTDTNGSSCGGRIISGLGASRPMSGLPASGPTGSTDAPSPLPAQRPVSASTFGAPATLGPQEVTAPARAVSAVELVETDMADGLGSAMAPRSSSPAPQPAATILVSSPGRPSFAGGLVRRWWSAIKDVTQRASVGSNGFVEKRRSGELASFAKLRSGALEGAIESQEDDSVHEGNNEGDKDIVSAQGNSLQGPANAAGETCWPGTSCSWGNTLAAAFALVPPHLAAEVEWMQTQQHQHGFKKTYGPYVRLASGRLGLVVYRGLRVRMGLHSGLDDPQHIVFNRVGSAYKYYGLFADTAKLVGDSAQGGVIALSAAAFARLRNSVKPGASAAGYPAQRDVTVIYGGHHVIPGATPAAAVAPQPQQQQQSISRLHGQVRDRSRDDEPSTPTLKDGSSGASVTSKRQTPEVSGVAHVRTIMVSQRSAARLQRPESRSPGMEKGGAAAQEPAAAGLRTKALPREFQLGQALFVAVPSPLLCRLTLSPPLRNTKMEQAGSLSAPVGCVAVGFMKVVGASTLHADLPGPAARAFSQFQGLVCALLGESGGYLVEGGDGLVLAVFGRHAAAVEWALACVAELKNLDWEDELLAHELCAAELVQEELSFRGVVQQTAIQQGLRIKVGLASGQVTHMLTQASGRLSYRGRVMNRAARVAGIAAAGQVLCTSALWESCQESEEFSDRVAGVQMGPVHLKGLSHPLELVQCHRI